MKFEKIVKMLPAHDGRDKDPNKNTGIHGVDLIMTLKGEKGAVRFMLYTNWQLPAIKVEELPDCLRKPLPADLGIHSPSPVYDGQEVSQKECLYLDNKPCYYDGSGLNAKPVYDVLLEKGSDGVWEYLENYYQEVFNQLIKAGDENE